MQAAGSLTAQLQAFSAGDREAAEAILREILPKLHQLAVRHLQRERYLAPVSPTELINEVWLRHMHKGGWQVRNREHFYAIAGCAMRRVLVDFARDRLALKRGAMQGTVMLDASVAGPVDTQSAEQIVEIGLLMEKLGKAQPKTLRVVDLHYFAGFSFDEIAEITGLSARQVRHIWAKGRDWLKDRMTPGSDRGRLAQQTASPSADAGTDRTRGPSRASLRILPTAE
jgi:RNA polymerase sigma-70 factor (ECF subfamily)